MEDLLTQHNLKQISDPKLITDIIKQIIDSNPTIVAEYPNRPERVTKFILGNLMAQTNGQVNPQVSNQIMEQTLNELFK
ncbi:hypothetical protein [Mycoplasma nasistruthionis]